MKICEHILPYPAAVLSSSALHFLAQNNHFDTLTEAWLWRPEPILFVRFYLAFLTFAAHMEKNTKTLPTAANLGAEVNAI